MKKAPRLPIRSLPNRKVQVQSLVIPYASVVHCCFCAPACLPSFLALPGPRLRLEGCTMKTTKVSEISSSISPTI